MRIFDFSDGKKGRCLGEISRISYMDISAVDGVSMDIGRYQYCKAVRAGSHPGSILSPDRYNKGSQKKITAICFCMGQKDPSQPQSPYNWCYTASTEIAQQLHSNHMNNTSCEKARL